MITIHCGIGCDMPAKEKFQMIKQAGFDGVLIMWSDFFGDVDFRDYPEASQKEGLYVENIHAPFDGINYGWTVLMEKLSLNDLLVVLMIVYHIVCLQ